MENNSIIAFVVRETGWSLEYIRDLPFPHLIALYHELHYLKAMDDYRTLSNFAALIGAWVGKSARDLIPEEPQREIMEGHMADLAQTKTPEKITLGDGKDYELAPVSLNIMADMEATFKESYDKMLGHFSMTHTRHLLFLRLKKKYSLTEEQVGDLYTLDLITGNNEPKQEAK